MVSIGIIGVGVIGKVFVDRLENTDHSVIVYDIDQSQMEYGIERGAERATDPADLTAQSDVVIMALPGTPEVELTLEDDDGVLRALSDDQLVIDATTTLPETSIKCESQCANHGAKFIEAPITGAAPRDGWHMMVGGTKANYESAKGVLDLLCDDYVRIGEAGQAQKFKLGLQMRYAGHHAIDAEIVEFARDNGIDAELFNEFLDMGIWEKYFTEDFSQEIEGLGSLAIWRKDIGYAQQVAHENNTALPLNSAVHHAYKATARQVTEDEGHASTLLKYWQNLNNADER